MTTVTTSIGSGGRDYSTITAWEADLDNGAIYASGDDAVGELYNDSTFAVGSATTINGGATVGLNSVKLSVAAGHRHDGARETGARILMTGGGQRLSAGRDNVTIEWIEFDGNGVATGRHGIEMNGYTATLAQALVFDVDNGTGHGGVRIDGASGKTLAVVNTILHTNGGDGLSINVGSVATAYVRNVTSHGNGEDGIGGTDAANNYVQNVISTSNGADFAQATPASATYDHNIASDTSASGTGSVDSVSASSLFVSTTAGSEDLHLVSGATDAIDAGADFGTTPAGVNIDINGRDRDSNGDTWDIGAHEYVAAGGGANSGPALLSSRQRRTATLLRM